MAVMKILALLFFLNTAFTFRKLRRERVLVDGQAGRRGSLAASACSVASLACLLGALLMAISVAS